MDDLDLPAWVYLLIGAGTVWWYFHDRHQRAAAAGLPTVAYPAPGTVPLGKESHPYMLSTPDGRMVPRPSWWDAPETTAQMRFDYLGLSHTNTIKWS